VFLVGGPAFSGTTLLALLLNQGNVVCLDEPDFHNPEQSHRGIPFLQEMFPERIFPERPMNALGFEQAVRLIEDCERAIKPHQLGIKTCDWTFIEYAKVCKTAGHPVIAIVRDIRDALVRRLPDWVTEESLNQQYRVVWQHRELFDVWLRYEDLIANPESSMAKISVSLAYDFAVIKEWDGDGVPTQMLKLDRHDLLKTGTISRSRVGVWRTTAKVFSARSHETAEMMGY